MAKFEFKEHGYPLELDIAGHAFTLNVTRETAKKLETYGKEAQRMGAELTGAPDGVEQAWRFMQSTLDGLLGEGATDAIWGDRDRDLMDIVDVMSYICGEIEQAAQKQTVRKMASAPAMELPQAKQQTVEQALRIMQAPEVVAAISKAMGRA